MTAPRRADPLLLVAPWTLTGAALGLVGELAWRLSWADARVALPGAVVGAVAGGVIWWRLPVPAAASDVERALAWPRRLVPLACLPLAVLGTVWTGSGWTAVVFLAVFAAGTWTALQRAQGRAVRTALADLHREVPGAAERVVDAASSRLATRAAQDEAATALGLHALFAGDPEQALVRLEGLRGALAIRRSSPWRALALILRGDTAAAAVALQRGVGEPSAAQDVDVVRLLWVARAHGAEDARVLAEGLAGHAFRGRAAWMFSGLRAWALHATGDVAGAKAALPQDPEVRALLRSHAAALGLTEAVTVLDATTLKAE